MFEILPRHFTTFSVQLLHLFINWTSKISMSHMCIWVRWLFLCWYCVSLIFKAGSSIDDVSNQNRVSHATPCVSCDALGVTCDTVSVSLVTVSHVTPCGPPGSVLLRVYLHNCIFTLVKPLFCLLYRIYIINSSVCMYFL